MARTSGFGFMTIVILLIGTGSAHADQADWLDHIELKGDFRYRNESIYLNNADARVRHRVRARLEIKAKAHDDVAVGIGFATGGDNPVSTNQTLDGGFTTKDINLDLAYFVWRPATFTDGYVMGGKMKSPFLTPGKSELVWDSDLRPEGLTAGFQTSGSTVKIAAMVGGFWIDESAMDDDVALLAVQGDIEINLSDNSAFFRIGGGYFDFSTLKGHSTIHDPEDGFGNSTGPYPLYEYLYDYDLLELFAEVGTRAGSDPVTVFGNYVSNSGRAVDNVGWLVGIRLGNAKRVGSWSARWNYRKLDSDAVLGVFTDSDFGGGGTDAEGHELGLNLQAAERITISGSLFFNKVGRYRTEDYKRTQLDLSMKF